ncbi:hypothetical protein Hdeb2414_s0004g00119811 [Helianthus debilis subsp. tardiflorus]
MMWAPLREHNHIYMYENLLIVTGSAKEFLNKKRLMKQPTKHMNLSSFRLKHSLISILASSLVVRHANVMR